MERNGSGSKVRSVRALEASNFFLADVQTGLGPFLAAYLAGSGWQPARIGFALTLAGVVTVVLQTPAGAFVDRVRKKRAVLVSGVSMLAAGAVLLALGTGPRLVYTAQTLLGAAAPLLAPTLAAITLGLVGKKGFDRQFGRNQSFNSAGNVACAAGIIAITHFFNDRAIFLLAAILAVPTIVAVLSIAPGEIDYNQARGCDDAEQRHPRGGGLRDLLRNQALLVFLSCAFLFHCANAAMLPQLGEMLARGRRSSAAPFMSACVVVTQVVIMCSAAWVGRIANRHGRKRLLLAGFGVLPVRAGLYTLTHWTPALIGIQLLDGVANAIFGVVSVLVIADLARGTGRFNLAGGALATAAGLGAALSTTFGGKLIEAFSFRISFLALGAVALAGLLLVLFALPETLDRSGTRPNHQGDPLYAA